MDDEEKAFQFSVPYVSYRTIEQPMEQNDGKVHNAAKELKKWEIPVELDKVLSRCFEWNIFGACYQAMCANISNDKSYIQTWQLFLCKGNEIVLRCMNTYILVLSQFQFSGLWSGTKGIVDSLPVLVSIKYRIYLGGGDGEVGSRKLKNVRLIEVIEIQEKPIKRPFRFVLIFILA